MRDITARLSSPRPGNPTSSQATPNQLQKRRGSGGTSPVLPVGARVTPGDSFTNTKAGNGSSKTRRLGGRREV